MAKITPTTPSLTWRVSGKRSNATIPNANAINQPDFDPDQYRHPNPAKASRPTKTLRATIPSLTWLVSDKRIKATRRSASAINPINQPDFDPYQYAYITTAQAA